jgi:tRNA 2-thiouridine synthesizing protein A
MSSTVDRELDLHGEVCPYTFVKSKLALEQMASGQVLEIVVDNGESASNVPRSLALEGHDVLGVDRGPDAAWRITVRKA